MSYCNRKLNGTSLSRVAQARGRRGSLSDRPPPPAICAFRPSARVGKAIKVRIMTSTSPYPEAPRQDITEAIHGRQVSDPYRWLEDAGSQQTKTWLKAEEELYARYVAAVPGLDRLTARLTELLAAGEVGAPVWRGDRYFLTRREPGQEHAVLYTADQAGTERALIDPTAIDPAGATTLDNWRPDREGLLLADGDRVRRQPPSVVKRLTARQPGDIGIPAPVDRALNVSSRGDVHHAQH